MDIIASRELKVNIIGDSRSLERALRNSGDAASTFGSKMGKMAKVVGLAALGAGAAVTAGFVYTLKRGFDELAESQKVMAQTEAGIKSTGGAAKVTAKDVESLAESLSLMSGVDDEVIQQGENLLLTFTKVRNEVGKGNDIFNRATQSALDLSVKGFGSMDSTSKMLGKALQDPVRGMTALGRAGVTFTEGQKETIKSLVESGKQLEAQKMILKEVETQVGGSAKAYGKTLAGQLDKARNAFDEMASKLAVKFLPILTKILNWVNENWPTIEKVFDAVGTAIIATFDAIGVAVNWLRNQWEIHRESAIATWNAVRDAVMAVINWFQANVVPAIQNVVAGIKTAWAVLTAIWSRFGTDILSVLSTAFGMIFAVVSTFVQNFLAPFKVMLALLRGDFGAAWDEIKGVFTRSLGLILTLLQGYLSIFGTIAKALGKAILDGIVAGLSALGNLITSTLGKIAGYITGLVGSVLSAATRLGRAILDGITAGLSALAGLITSTLGRIAGFITGLVGVVGSAATRLGKAILDGIRSGASAVGGVISSTVGKIPGYITGLVGSVLSAATAIGKAILTGIVQGAAGLAAKVAGLVQQVLDVLSGAAATVYGFGYRIGANIVRGIVDGVLAMINWAKGVIESALGFLKNLSPFSSVREGGEKYIGRELMIGAAEGAVKEAPKTAAAVAFATRMAANAGQVAARTWGDTIGRDLIMAVIRGVDGAKKALANAAGISVKETADYAKQVASYAKEVGWKIALEAANGLISKTETFKGQMRAFTKAGVDAAREEAARQKELWASTFGALAQAGLDAIAAKYAGWKPPALKKLEEFDYAEMWKGLNKAVEDTGEAFTKAWNEGLKLTSELERILSVKDQLAKGVKPEEVTGLTEEEKKKMAGMTPEEAVTFVNEREAAARGAIEANNVTTLAALTAFEEAKKAVWRQKQVELVAEQTAAHEEDVKREQGRFTKLLTAIQKSGPVTARELRKLWDTFGIDFFAAGELWTQALADGLNSEASKGAVAAAAREIAQIVSNNIKPQKSPAKEGPLSKFDMKDAGRQYGMDFAAGLKSSAGVVRPGSASGGRCGDGCQPRPPCLPQHGHGRRRRLQTGQLDPVITNVINVYVSGVVGNPQQVARAITPAISEELRRRERRGAPVISGAF